MSSKLTQKVVLVAGGAGTVGSGIVRALLKQGVKAVIVPSRDPKRLEKLIDINSDIQNAKERIVTVQEDVGDEKGAEAVKQFITDKFGEGSADHVVASLGGWWQKGLTTHQSYQEFHWLMNNLLGSHFVASKTFLPLIADKPGSTYTIVTGTSGERVILPEAGLVTVFASAVYGLVAALRSEFEKREVSINEYRIGMLVCPDEVIKSGKAPAIAVSNYSVGELLARALAAGSTKNQRVNLINQEDFEKTF